MLTIFTLPVTSVAENAVTNKAAQSASHNQKSQSKKADSPVSTSAQSKEGVPLQAPAAEEHNESIYTNDAKTEWWARITDTLVALGTLALAFIGGFAAKIAFRTLNTIQEQTGHLRTAAEAAGDNAKAALLNAQAVIDAERPWLLIPMGDEFSQIENPILISRVAGEYRHSYCIFRLKNFGRSTAKVTEEKLALFHGIELDVIPDATIFDRKDVIIEDYAFPPNTTIPNQATFELDGRITPQEYEQIVSQKSRFLWLCGYFRYRDTFARADAPEYETRFCYRWVCDATSATDSKIRKSFWIMAGPREYNRAI